MTERAHRLVTRLQGQIEALEIGFSEAYWRSQIEATPENDRRRLELEIELRKLKGDPAELQQVEAASSDPIHEPILRRQLEVLRLSLTGNQMSDQERELVVELATAVESDFASHRAVVGEERYSDNEIDEVLKSSDDEDLRRRVWTASKGIGAVVAERVRELVRVRNAAARNLGFADFYQMELELQEMSEEWLFEMMDDLERLTDEPFRRWKGDLDAGLRERFDTEDLYPWHYADPFFQTLPPDGRVNLDDTLTNISAADISKRTFDSWGIDLSKVLERSDIYPRERKCQHAFCLERGPERRCPDPRERGSGRALDRGDAARVGSRRLRRIDRSQPPVPVAPPGPHVRYRGHGTPIRTIGPRHEVADPDSRG